MNCSEEKPCANCLAIIKACKHETTFVLDVETKQCVFCDKKIKIEVKT